MCDPAEASTLLNHPDGSLACFNMPPRQREFFETSLDTSILFYVHSDVGTQCPPAGNRPWTLKPRGWNEVKGRPDLDQRSVSCSRASDDGFKLTGVHPHSHPAHPSRSLSPTYLTYLSI